MNILLYNYDILPIIIVCIVFMLVAVVHRIFLPHMYSSILEFKYEGNINKTLKSSCIRILYVVLLTILFVKIFKFSEKQVYFGILLSCFLNVWPAIIQYRLIEFHRSKEKAICLFGYISFIGLSVLISYITNQYISPMLFDGKEYFLLDNSGLGIIKGIILLILPMSFEAFLAKISSVVVSQDIQSFREELRILNYQMDFETYITDLYEYEIKSVCERNDISTDLLNTIIKLEYIHRGKWYYNLFEKIISKFFTNVAIKKDISIGISQIKISTAKEVLEKSPTKFVKKLADIDFNLEVCGKLLNILIEDYYNTEKDDLIRDECEDVYEYIANKYLCSIYSPMNRSVLIYSAVLRSKCPNLNFMTA